MFILHIFWFLMAAINSFTISSKSLTIKALQQEVLTSWLLDTSYLFRKVLVNKEHVKGKLEQFCNILKDKNVVEWNSY